MDKETRTALEESIEHWKENAAQSIADAASTYSEDCALCHAFAGEDATSPCHGCPVAERTGELGCVDSPWEKAHDALFQWRATVRSPFSTQARVLAARDSFRAAATEELEFLQSLLPKDATSCED